MTREDIHDLVRLYALNALSDEEQETARRYLESGDAECLAIFAETQALAAQLPLSLDPVAPPAAVKNRLMGRIGKSAPGSSPIAPAKRANPSVDSPVGVLSSWFRPIISAAIAAGIAYFATSISFHKETGELKRQLSQVQGSVSAMRESQQTQDQMIDTVMSPAVQMASLEGDAQLAPGARGRVFWDRSNGNWVMRISGMKPLPEGRAYELWFIVDGKAPIASSTFLVDANGAGSIKLQVPKGIGNITLAAVTIEPASGSSAPTSPIVLKGAITTQ